MVQLNNVYKYVYNRLLNVIQPIRKAVVAMIVEDLFPHVAVNVVQIFIILKACVSLPNNVPMHALVNLVMLVHRAIRSVAVLALDVHVEIDF